MLKVERISSRLCVDTDNRGRWAKLVAACALLNSGSRRLGHANRHILPAETLSLSPDARLMTAQKMERRMIVGLPLALHAEYFLERPICSTLSSSGDYITTTDYCSLGNSKGHLSFLFAVRTMH